MTTKYHPTLGSTAYCPGEVKRADLRKFVQHFQFNEETMCEELAYLLETGDHYHPHAPGQAVQYMTVGSDYPDKDKLRALMTALYGEGLYPSSFVIALEEANPNPTDGALDRDEIANMKATLVHPEPMPCGGYRFLVDPLSVRPKDMRF